ncbi:Hypothetical predicted protein [Paramuricea clavata]|uniref:Uncharacterized protein n=1 Tax=Paramuricea clavata TaxID=317549 RepID=A0A6S7HXS5_PARCT|nr:Hypothetical predicted protein [Paramuricea clavata]
MAEALRMFKSSEDESNFEGVSMDETVEETRPIAAGTSMVSWREIAGDSDEEEEDFDGFSDIEVQELDSDSVSESGSEISSDGFDDIFEWKDNLSSVSVEDFTADFGPRHGLGLDASPKDFFDLFFGDQFFDHIVHATISYARSNHNDQNFTTNRDEMSAFFGLNILMGINRLPTIRSYWDSDLFLGNAGFKTTMPSKRFLILNRYFHISDPQQENPTDKLAILRPLISKLDKAFQDVYVPGKNISIDEGLVKFNGRLSFKQYMPKKPNRFGIKVWMLADSETYFVPRFQVYLGKQQNADENDAVGARGLGFKVVDFLGKPYYNTYRHFYFDNYFSSVPLLEHLLENKTYACSTLRHNRKQFPADLKKVKLKRGEIRTRQNKNLVCMTWQDKRLVTILSTNVDPQPEVFGPLNERTAKRKAVPDNLRVKPAVISFYNKFMNGVDVNDQYRSYYPVGAQSKKWWKYLAWFFVNISIVNGFILQNLQTDRRRRLKHLDFRLALARQLISNYNGYKRISSAPTSRKKDVPVGRNVKGHSLVLSSERKRACVMCAKAGRKRASGRTFESKYKCAQCNVNLCRERACFMEWHQ